MNRSRPANSTISSNLPSSSRLDRPRIEPLGNTFSPAAIPQQTRPLAVYAVHALVRSQDLRRALEHGRLARPVLADDAEGLAPFDLERHVLQGPELLVAGPPAPQDGRLQVLVLLVVE